MKLFDRFAPDIVNHEIVARRGEVYGEILALRAESEESENVDPHPEHRRDQENCDQQEPPSSGLDELEPGN